MRRGGAGGRGFAYDRDEFEDLSDSDMDAGMNMRPGYGGGGGGGGYGGGAMGMGMGRTPMMRGGGGMGGMGGMQNPYAGGMGAYMGGDRPHTAPAAYGGMGPQGAMGNPYAGGMGGGMNPGYDGGAFPAAGGGYGNGNPYGYGGYEPQMQQAGPSMGMGMPQMQTQQPPRPRARKPDPRNIAHIAQGPYATPVRGEGSPRRSRNRKERQQGDFPELDSLDACICTTNCTCKKGHRVMYFGKPSDRSGNGDPFRGEIRYVLKDDLGRDCGDHSGCYSSNGKRKGKMSTEEEIHEINERLGKLSMAGGRGSAPANARDPYTGIATGYPGSGVGNGMQGYPDHAMGMPPGVASRMNPAMANSDPMMAARMGLPMGGRPMMPMSAQRMGRMPTGGGPYPGYDDMDADMGMEPDMGMGMLDFNGPMTPGIRGGRGMPPEMMGYPQKPQRHRRPGPGMPNPYARMQPMGMGRGYPQPGRGPHGRRQRMQFPDDKAMRGMGGREGAGFDDIDEEEWTDDLEGTC
jgi:hypothetical protein